MIPKQALRTVRYAQTPTGPEKARSKSCFLWSGFSVYLALDGGRGRNRTFNLSIKSRMLCQLSYASDGLSFSLADVPASAEHFIEYSTDPAQCEQLLLRTWFYPRPAWQFFIIPLQRNEAHILIGK